MDSIQFWKKTQSKNLNCTNRIFFKTGSVPQHPQMAEKIFMSHVSHDFSWEVFFFMGELNQAQVYFWVLGGVMECTIGLPLAGAKIASSLFLTGCTYEALLLVHWYCNWILPRLNFHWWVFIHQFSCALSMSWRWPAGLFSWLWSADFWL